MSVATATVGAVEDSAMVLGAQVEASDAQMGHSHASAAMAVKVKVERDQTMGGGSGAGGSGNGKENGKENGKDSDAKNLPPFLQKLKMIAETVPVDIADWAIDGLSYVVKDNDRFEEVLKQHFKGSLQTFIRQLHFYGFRKLDANSGWSFVHKHFRKDKPEQIFEIKRKTRAETHPTGVATQVEVQQLRAQVSSLQNVVEDLRTQLDTVLSVINSNKATENSSSNSNKNAATIAQPPVGHKKRTRFESMSSIASNTTEDIDSSRPPLNTAKETTHNYIKLEQVDDFDFSKAEPDFFQAAGAEGPSSSSIEPYPVDMEGIDDEIFNLSVSDGLYKQLSAEDGPGLGESDFEAVATNEAEKQAQQGTVEAVANATELDPKSVQKVLAFVNKAVMSDKQQKQATNLSFPLLKHAILKYQDQESLPTQQVGAN